MIVIDPEIKVAEILDGTTDLLEAADRLREKANEFTSLAGQGYRLAADEIKDGYGFLVKPDNTLTNDRDRLATAFMDLQYKHKYKTPIHFAWEADCVHEASELLQEDGVADDAPIVFWVSETDDDAFGYQGWSDEVVERMPENQEERAAWFKENVDYVKSQEVAERLAHHTLVGPLPLYWRGDAALIVKTLREHGLEVVEPESEEMCIVVLPHK